MGQCAAVFHLYEWSPVRFIQSGAAADLEKKYMLDSLLITPAFLDLSNKRVEEILDAMCDPKGDNERLFRNGEYLCKIGDKSDCFWYVRSGEIAVFSAEGKQVAVKKKGDLTGEVGMIQNVNRTATLKVTRLSTIIRIKREDYTKVRSKADKLEASESYNAMMKTGLFVGWEKRTMMNVLDIMRGTVPERRVMNSTSKKVSVIPAREKTDAERTFPPGHVVMTQGEKPHPQIVKKGEKTVPASDYMYVVETGSCDVWIGNNVVAKKKAGEFFGEMALLNDSVRSATIKVGSEGATLLMINRQEFNRYFLRDRSKFEYTIMQLQRKVRAPPAHLTVENRRALTSKRASLAIDLLDDHLDDRYTARIVKSDAKGAAGSPPPPPPAPSPTSAAAADGEERGHEESEGDERGGGQGLGGVLLNPVGWIPAVLDWVPGMSSSSSSGPPPPPLQAAH